MLETRRLFIMHDQHSDVSGSKEVLRQSAEVWNQKGYGVHWAVNDFIGERRIENVTKINSWYFEVDDKPKSYQLALIDKGLIPSLIVESKNSYHTYFFSKDAKVENFREIQDRLILFYGSDPNLKNPAGTLRAPGFKHLKDINDPFEVKIIWHKPHIAYTEAVMKHFYKPRPTQEQKKLSKPVTAQEAEFFELIYNMDHRLVLTSFSGTQWVNGERYTFKDNRNGKHNILVDGKQTSCFVDADGRIGANGGGPTIWQWLKYFGHDSKTIRRAIKEVLGC
jgi:hypothetical protein